MLHIVLIEPEIPQNTGNIARTCVAFNITLHLIKPYGFLLTEKQLIRSGLDYWKHLKIKEYDSYDHFTSTINKEDELFYLSRYGTKKPNEFKYNCLKKEIYLVLGKESIGIDKNILKDNKQKTIRIPTTSKVRSLNLSNCAAIMAYEVIKQSEYNDLEIKEPFKPIF